MTATSTVGEPSYAIGSETGSEFYQEHLDRVSRSFAFCIRQLPEPLRARVGLAYLLCRALDTVEDAIWNSQEDQRECFDAFERFIAQPAREADVRAWAARFPRSIPDGEKRLLAAASALFADFHALPAADRAALEGPILSMARGMRRFAERRAAGALRLADQAEVNRYCFFVAGVVGEALTRVAALYVADFRADQSRLLDSYHFGLFLQKVNLLKDQSADEREGRFLIPDRRRARASLDVHAERALAYVLAIPRDQVGYRTFCAWSLFLGLASLPFIDAAWAEDAPKKITRDQTKEVLDAVEAAASDDEALRSLYAVAIDAGVIGRALDGQAPDVSSLDRLGRASADFSAHREIYDGDLSDESLRALQI